VSLDAAAYLLVFGLIGLAFLFLAASQVLRYRIYDRLRTLHPEKWEDVGAPSFFGGRRSDLSVAGDWLLSPEAAELDMTLARQARLARNLNYVGGAIFLAWLGLWVCSVLF
jgi:hypothetical protein